MDKALDTPGAWAWGHWASHRYLCYLSGAQGLSPQGTLDHSQKRQEGVPTAPGQGHPHPALVPRWQTLPTSPAVWIPRPHF